MGRVQAPDAQRRLFLHMWRSRHEDQVAWRHVTDTLSNPVISAAARVWIAEEREAAHARHVALENETICLRSSLRAVSVLLERLCACEGLPLAAVAHGVLPRTHLMSASEGFPWRPMDASRRHGEGDRSVAAGRAVLLRRGPGAVVRPAEHEKGGWIVRQVRGVLLADFNVGAGRVRCGFDRTATLRLPGELPDLVCSSLAGRALGDLVDHPVLSGGDLLIRSARPLSNRTYVRFTAPFTPVRFEELVATGPEDLHQLGRDGSLSGKEAMADVLVRGAKGSYRSPPRALLGQADALGRGIGVDWERLLRINLMAPPWCEKLDLRDGPEGWHS